MKEKLNYFCGGRNYFLYIPKLLHEFGQQYHTSGTQQAVENLNIFKLTLDACKYVYPDANFHTIMLAWDTGAQFVLTPFKSDFVDYVECDIPIKDVTKVNKVIGIGTTIHKL